MTNPLEHLFDSYDSGQIDRRQLLQGLAGVFFAANAAPAAAAPGVLQVKNLNHVGISSPQVNRSRDWYQKLLGLRADTIEEDKRVYLRVPGSTFISINQARTASLNHFNLGVAPFDARNPKATVDSLKAAGFEARLADAYSVFVTDPDGLLVQLSAPNFTGLEDHPKK